MKSLACYKANLAFSNQTTFELARTFLATKPQAAERGRRLFSHFKKFIDANTPCVKTIWNCSSRNWRPYGVGQRQLMRFLVNPPVRHFGREVDRASQMAISTNEREAL